ncbi:MAG: ABC transporter ATP-binding protein [Clostridiaceae bacterium]|jgi:multiple sugar transport system ATP-binding protein|nr:ABC transporter ATP-binding protein [Clostridiaceae bacterium]
MSRIELKNIDKFFGDNHVLRNLNLVIEDGDFMTLLGPSGCGKTTLLRVVAGLEKPQNGTMTIDGVEIINAADALFVEPSKRDLNLVFQSYALWPHMTAYNNVAFGLKIKKIPAAKIEEMVMKSLRLMRIDELKDRYPNELSGGQQQRVAIARAIASEPKLILLDEPLSNLDAKLRIDMRAELKRLHREIGATIIYVTHDQIEALTMSTKIALFEEGCLAQVAPPMELYMNPIDLVAADFIGNPRINFLKGTASYSNEKLHVKINIGEYDFDKEDMTEEPIPEGEFPCVVGLRPEQVYIHTEAVESSIPATIYAGQPAGSETLVTLTVGGQEFLAKEIGLKDYEMGQTVYLEIDPNKLNVYDEKSTRLIKLAV